MDGSAEYERYQRFDGNGFIHPKNNREILLYPMIREIAVEEWKPSVNNSSVLLDSLQEISLI